MKNNWILKYISSLILFLLLIGCTKNNKNGEFTARTNPNYTDTFVYDANSTYRHVLKGCVSATKVRGSCSLNTLPFIGQEEGSPSKETIMKRVVVSHDWMAERFAQMLDVLDDDIKQLLGSTTAIVIDDDIIPAYYWSLTGAIYLDPRYLWLTPAEAKTISRRSDFRSGNGSTLPYIRATRFVKYEQYASRYYSLDGNVTRTLEDIKYNFAHLLYHELAHANDFAPKHLLPSLNRSKSVYATLESLTSQRVSVKLMAENPLTSSFLHDLGRVWFHGVTPSSELMSSTASEIGSFFVEDSAVDMYAYSSPFEDVAMMFEVVMLKYHYGIERDIAFLSKEESDDNTTATIYKVGWGVRHRVASEEVRQRAMFVVKSILPDVTDWDSYFTDDLGESYSLRDVSWQESIHLEANASGQQKYQDAKQKINPMDFELPPL